MIENGRKSGYEWNMYYGAKPVTRLRAKSLRKKMTDAELIVWEHVRNRKIGFKFRRQHPIGKYIVDFYCHELKLVIEVDGEIHNFPEQKEWDDARTENMHLKEITVIRFTNDEVLNNITKVITEIVCICKALSSPPSPPGEGSGVRK